jgi:hypothetical protein
MILAILLVLSTTDQIPCWKAKAFITYAGSVSEAEKLAEKHGYTRTQIAEVRRRCAL